MKLQRILAKDSRSANEQAIAKYGRDVLVVSNNRVNGMTELIVAVDVEPERMPPPVLPRAGGEPFESALRQQRKPAPADPHTPQQPAAGVARVHGDAVPAASEEFIPAHMALMQVAQRAAAQSLVHSQALRPSAAQMPPAAPARPERPPILRFGQQIRLQTNAMSPVPQAPVTPIQSDRAQALTDLIRAEIAQLRKELRMGQQLNAWAAQGPSHRWNEALAEAGVPTMLRALLMSSLSNDFDDEQALATIEEQMMENLPRVRTSGERNDAGSAWTTGVHLLSGPSGSGKTSMAARLAHEAAQRLGVDRVVLVSWNDNRPGAWGQVQLWASRIGVAAFRAADSGTLDLLLQEHRGSLIIVDSGLSQPDILNAAVQGLNATHHLVMPADANASTVRRWVGEQAPAWCDVLVTRLDESAQPWPLLQACCERQLMPAVASEGTGLNQLRLPYNAQALLQQGMVVLANLLGVHGGEQGLACWNAVSQGLDIPTIDRITTTVPPRQAGRSGRSAGAAGKVVAAAEVSAAGTARHSATHKAGASCRPRTGASHA